MACCNWGVITSCWLIFICWRISIAISPLEAALQAPRPLPFPFLPALPM
jgi:hypothetical protein